MNELYEKNISVLRKKNDLVDFDRLLKADTSLIDTVMSKTGEPVPLVLSEGKKVAIHSKYDPVREAERFLSEAGVDGYDLFVVLGFGFGFHIERLLELVGADSSVLVIERSYGMMKSAFQSRDFSSVFSDERMLMLVDPDDDLISRIMKGRSSRKITFLLHRGSSQADGEYYRNMLNMVKSYISTKEANIATLAKFEKLWNSNIARNINALVDFPGVTNFYSKFDEYEAIIAGAGPSLEKSIEFISSNQNSRIIIAVDTAYSILIRNGITPHFTLCVDPQVVNARYFENFIDSDTILVTDPTVHPSVLRFFTGRKIISSPAFDTLKWVEKYTGEKGEVTHGGSVSTNAYDFAKRLGVRKIYLVGQDLSFTGRLAHARGSYLDEQIHNVTWRLKNQEMFNIRQMRALPPIYMDSIGGGRAHTNQKMVIFLNWFEKRSDPDLINATVEGIKIKNMTHLTHDEIGCLPETGIQDHINRIFSESEANGSDRKHMRERIADNITVLENEISTLLERLESAVRMSEELCSIVNSSDRKRITEIIKRLDSVDEYIYSRVDAKDMIGLSVQKTIHSITEGYDIDEETDERLKPVRKSLFLYRGLREGGIFNMKILEKMKKIVS